MQNRAQTECITGDWRLEYKVDTSLKRTDRVGPLHCPVAVDSIITSS